MPPLAVAWPLTAGLPTSCVCHGAGSVPAVVTVNGAPLLATPFTVTTTFPVVAPLGTGTAMLLAVQLVGVAAVPLNRTLLVPCVDPKLLPAIVTVTPTDPVLGDTDAMLGAAGAAVVTVNTTPLLATPPTVTRTFPLVAPLGTGTTMLVVLQFSASRGSR